jgi:hypothetical protein
MAFATRSEAQATAAPAAAGPERRSAPAAMPDVMLRLQRTAGNSAVKHMIQRCGAGGCTCGGACGGGHSAEEELLEEQLGAGLLRSAVANRSA